MNNKVILICGGVRSGKTRLATETAELPYKAFYWDSMQKSMDWVNKHKGDAQTIIIEGLTERGMAESAEFLKEWMDESEQYLIFTMLTDKPLLPIDHDGRFSRIDLVIDLWL